MADAWDRERDIAAEGQRAALHHQRTGMTPNATTRAAMEEARTMSAADPRDKRIAILTEALTFLLGNCGGSQGGKPPYSAPSEGAVNVARNALNIPHR